MQKHVFSPYVALTMLGCSLLPVETCLMFGATTSLSPVRCRIEEEIILKGKRLVPSFPCRAEPPQRWVQAVGTVTCPVMPVMSATFLLCCPPFTALPVPAFSPHWAIRDVWCLPGSWMEGLAQRMCALDADKREWQKTFSASVNLDPTHQNRRVEDVTGSVTGISQ